MKTQTFSLSLNNVSQYVIGIKKKQENAIYGIDCVLSNGYELSIIKGRGTYSNKDTFEVAVIRDGYIAYDITDGDVLGYQSAEQVRQLICKVGSLSTLK